MKGLESFLVDWQTIVSLVTKAEIVAVILSLVPYKGADSGVSQPSSESSVYPFCQQLYNNPCLPLERGKEFQNTMMWIQQSPSKRPRENTYSMNVCRVNDQEAG